MALDCPDNFILDKRSYDWDKMTEGELIDYLRVRPGLVSGTTTGGALVCHGPTLEWCRKFGAKAEGVLQRRGIYYTIQEDEEEKVASGDSHWWRSIIVVR